MALRALASDWNSKPARTFAGAGARGALTTTLHLPRIFLSLASKDKPLVERLRSQAAASLTGPCFRDCSLDQPVPEWKRHAQHLIRSSVATLCLVGWDRRVCGKRKNASYVLFVSAVSLASC